MNRNLPLNNSRPLADPSGRPERSRGAPRSGVRAFTLLEVLVTIGLIALLSGVLVGGSMRLLDNRPVSADDIFREAVYEARKAAVETNEEVRLSFDPKEKHFNLDSGGGARTFPLTGSPDLIIELLAAQKGGPAALLRGVLVETQTLPFVTFYPDGTCSAFRVQFRSPGSSRVIAIDPWTCAPMLEAEET